MQRHGDAEPASQRRRCSVTATSRRRHCDAEPASQRRRCSVTTTPSQRHGDAEAAALLYPAFGPSCGLARAPRTEVLSMPLRRVSAAHKAPPKRELHRRAVCGPRRQLSRDPQFVDLRYGANPHTSGSWKNTEQSPSRRVSERRRNFQIKRKSVDLGAEGKVVTQGGAASTPRVRLFSL